jgi:trk system potassium uptake protein TrkA
MKIVVVGAGKVGFDISKVLSEEGHDVVVIDKDPAALRPVVETLDVMSVAGNGASAAVLEEIGIKTVDIIIAVTDNDELNMIACMTAKQCGVPMTVARVRNPEYTSPHPYLLSYARFGLDLIINPEHLAAQEIFRLVEFPMATDMEYFADGRLSMVGVKLEGNMGICGKYIRELGLTSLTIVAVSRDGKIIIPDGNTQLLPKDKLFLVGATGGFHSLNGLIRAENPNFKRIVIAGGGLVTRYLVGLLRSRKKRPEIKIIEVSEEKSKELARELEGCEVVLGDATKIEVFAEENLGPGDIFIALTGVDNSNLVASMLAHKRGVEEIICQISREDYLPLAEMSGVTAAIIPRLLTVSTVLKLVRTSNVLSISLLSSGEAEFIELKAEPGSAVTQKPLRDLAMPSKTIIGAVLHGQRVIVPRGDTQIHPGDRALVFSLRTNAPAVEELFRAENPVGTGENNAF